MVSFTTSMPLADAVDQLSRRTPLGSTLSAAEWALAPAEIRLRSMFAARMEEERILAEMQRRILQRVRLERSTLANGAPGVTMDRSRFIDEMREVLRKYGYEPEPKHKGTLRDFMSTGRLGLIWQMNLDQAQGYAQWKTGNSPVALKMWPVMEFVRLEARMEHRNWPAIWAAHGGKFYGEPGPDYPAAPGRMMALVTDQIWTAINRFGVPWKPFDWGSGMGTRNVRRAEALNLGVIQPGDAPQVPWDVPYNQGAQASLKAISPARRRAIEDAFCGDVEIEGDVIRITPPERMDAMAGPRRKVTIAPFSSRSQAAPKPDGTPLVDVLKIADSKARATVVQAVRKGIALMDDVHGDGVVPQLQIALRIPALNEAQAGGYFAVTSRDKLPRMFINPNAIDPVFTTLHETGHLLDNLGFHTPTPERKYASGGQPEFEDLMRHLRRSVAAGRLAGQVGSNDNLLSSHELFARAYAQFIAERSGEADLYATIRAIRQGSMMDAGVYKNSQWTWADFNPISRTLGNLLQSLGWISGL